MNFNHPYDKVSFDLKQRFSLTTPLNPARLPMRQPMISGVGGASLPSLLGTMVFSAFPGAGVIAPALSFWDAILKGENVVLSPTTEQTSAGGAATSPGPITAAAQGFGASLGKSLGTGLLILLLAGAGYFWFVSGGPAKMFAKSRRS